MKSKTKVSVMNFNLMKHKSKQLTSQMTGIYELSISDFSRTDLTGMVELALDLCSSLCSDIQNNTSEPTDFSPRTKPEATKYNFTPLNSFATRLRLALAHSGMTQGVLADWIGVSQSTISSLVTGKVEPDIERADNIANALDVRFRWLMFGDGGMYKNLINGDEV